MKYVIALIPLLVVALGVLAVIGGGMDDSPGAQLIGLVLIVGAVVLVVRGVRHSAP